MAEQTQQTKAVAKIEERGLLVENAQQRELAEDLRDNIRTIMVFQGPVDGESPETTARKVVRSVMLATVENPDLLKADRNSLILSVLRAVRMGLDPSGTLGSAYLVPYRDKKRGGGQFVQLIPGYRGLVDKAIECGAAIKIWAETYHDNDDWEYLEGTNCYIRHRKCLTGTRGKFIAAYACAKVGTDDVQFTIIPSFEMDAFIKDTPSWRDYPLEMMKKTAVRRLMKSLALNPDRHARLAEILMLDDRADQGLMHRDDEEALINLAQSTRRDTPQSRARAALSQQNDDAPDGQADEADGGELNDAVAQENGEPIDAVKKAVIALMGAVTSIADLRKAWDEMPAELRDDSDVMAANDRARARLTSGAILQKTHNGRKE